MVNSGVVVSQEVGADVLDVLPILLAKVTRPIVVAKSIAKGQPGVGSVDVSLIVNNFVHLSGDMGLVLCGETANDDVVIEVITSDLSVHIVRLATIRTC